jgi:hypothetical protein
MGSFCCFAYTMLDSLTELPWYGSVSMLYRGEGKSTLHALRVSAERARALLICSMSAYWQLQATRPAAMSHNMFRHLHRNAASHHLVFWAANMRLLFADAHRSYDNTPRCIPSA